MNQLSRNRTRCYAASPCPRTWRREPASPVPLPRAN